MRVLIDPARGGPLKGCEGPTGLCEAEATTLLARELGQLLDGFEVYYTRRTVEEHVSLTERVGMASRADLTVALAFSSRAWEDRDEQLEVRANPASPLSWRAGSQVVAACREAGVDCKLSDNTKHALFCRQPRPAIRVFAGHLSSATTEKLSRSGDWGRFVAGLLARGIEEAASVGRLEVTR